VNNVGIRELETHLSRHLARVRYGARLIVTEHGRAIAAIDPVETPNCVEWARAMVAAGRAQREDRRPQGFRLPAATAGGALRRRQ